MAIAAQQAQVAWWREPTRGQWHAWIAAWLGWTLDAFDFTIFLLIMLPISQEFHVPLVAVTAVLALTLWMRLVGAMIPDILVGTNTAQVAVGIRIGHSGPFDIPE
jgi:hypothetical protein